MNKAEIKTILESLLKTSGATAKRKDIIQEFVSRGENENITYPFLLPSNRGDGRGVYDLTKCLKTLNEEKVEKEIEVETEDTELSIDDIFDSLAEEEKEMAEDEEGDGEVNTISGVINYTEDDIAEELQLMATTI